VRSLDEAYSKNWATNWAERFHPGDTVTAYVNPGAPGDSFLVQESELPLLPGSWWSAQPSC
jgi:hypothetical protein